MARKNPNHNGHPHPILSGFTEWAHLPTRFHVFHAAVYVEPKPRQEHLVLVKGKPSGKKDVLVRIQSECMTGDVFGSKRCDCYDQLQKSLALIEKKGEGIVLYLRQEGRGIGLANKIRAYHLQDQGFDTIEANHQLGLPVDARDFTVAADILKELHVKSVTLLTNNPQKISQLERYGIEVVERVAHSFPANGHNENYLRTKAERAGHLL